MPPSYKVILTEGERAFAIDQGKKRTDYARRHNYVSHFEDPFKDQIGCMAELACCNYLGERWKPVLGTDRYRCDIPLADGTLLQVRGSRYPERDWGKRTSVLSYDAEVVWTYLFARAYPTRYDVLILGWCLGERIPHLGVWKDKKVYPKMKCSAWSILVELLKDTKTLTKKPYGQLELF